MNSEELLQRIKQCLQAQLNNLAHCNPPIAFVKPIICKVIENKLCLIKPYLELLEDANGAIDVRTIVEEMYHSLMSSETFTLETPLGPILLGNNKVEMALPFTDKMLVLNKSDLDAIKVALIR